jgi:hypothetical protein
MQKLRFLSIKGDKDSYQTNQEFQNRAGAMQRFSGSKRKSLGKSVRN